MEPQICGDLEEMRPYRGKEKPRSAESGSNVLGHDQRGEGPNRRDKPPGCGVTVTNWRMAGD